MSWLEKYADYDRHRDAIEEAATRNPYPFKSWFDGTGRAYIPLYGNAAEMPSPLSKDDWYIISLLKEINYIVDEESYKKGYAASGKRTVRIGKILRDYVEREKKRLEGQIATISPNGKLTGDVEKDLQYTTAKEELKELAEIMPMYENSPSRKNQDRSGLQVVISQRPHDVGSMSTDRSWTSCMNLDGGQHRQAVYCEVEAGSLVAYLIKDGDPEIGHPIGRIHIKRFVSDDGRSIAVPEGMVYGTDAPDLVSAFQGVVKQWIDSKQGEIGTGIYKRVGGSWSDTLDGEIVNFGSVQDALDHFFNPPTTYRVEVDPNAKEQDETDLERENFSSREEAQSAAENTYDIDNSWRQYYGDIWLEEDDDGNYYSPYVIHKEINQDVARKALSYIVEHLDELDDETVRSVYDATSKWSSDRGKMEERLGIKHEKLDTRTQAEKDRELRKQFDSMQEGGEREAHRHTLAQLATERMKTLDTQNETRKLDADLNYENNLNDALKLVDGIYDASRPMPEGLVRDIIAVGNSLDAKADEFAFREKENKDKFVRRVAGSILAMFAKNKEHSPLVLSYCRRVAAMIAEMPAEKEAVANHLTKMLFWELWALGGQAREFVPFIKERMALLQAAYKPHRIGIPLSGHISTAIMELYKEYGKILSDIEKSAAVT
jgi:hypothetical protein